MITLNFHHSPVPGIHQLVGARAFTACEHAVNMLVTVTAHNMKKYNEENQDKNQ